MVICIIKKKIKDKPVKEKHKGKIEKIVKAKTSNNIPEINIGLVGHVDHGKTSLIAAITGKWSDTHSEEIKRGITIRLGYADASIYECPKCKGHNRYGTYERCIKCFSSCKYVRTVSFVDVPGHETLMTTVLSGTALMDGALLIISADEKCPQPQTREHLSVLKITGIKNIVVVQNKIDLVTKEEAIENYNQIRAFLKESIAENAPIIPVSAQQRINIDALLEAIEKYIPTPKRDISKDPLLYVARSFDVNKPGTAIENLKGSVLGGSIINGEIKIGDEIEIKPGIFREGEFIEVKTKVTGVQKAGIDLERAGPGGLVGMSTTLDPAIGKSDGLAGNVVGRPGTLPDSSKEISFIPYLLDRVVGSKEDIKVEGLKTGDALMVAAGVSRTVGTVTIASDRKVHLKLKMPIVVHEQDRIAISRQVSGRWRLIGWGEVI